MKKLIAGVMLMFAASVMASPPPLVGEIEAEATAISLSSAESSSEARSRTNVSTGDTSLGVSTVISAEPIDLSQGVPSVYASSLTTSNGTCMGSSTASLSGSGFGIGGGSTWTDAECSARYNASQMKALGLNSVAVELMCDIEAVYKARKRVGKACARQSRYEPAVNKAIKPVAVWSIPITHTTVEEDLR